MALAGVRFYVLRSALPATGPDEFYMEDLIGLAVAGVDGAALGRIVGVHNFGAGDVVEIGELAGRTGTFFAPFTRAAFPSVDLIRGVAVMKPEVLPQDGSDEADLVTEAMRQEDA